MSSPHDSITSQLPLSLSTESHRNGRSRAQTCLFKILRIISLFPAVDVSYTQRLSHDDRSCENIGFGVDLNIGLGASTEFEPFEYPRAANSGADCEDCVQEAVEEERAMEQSEISHVGYRSSGFDCNGVSQQAGGENIREQGYLDLLIEAAQLILVDECEPRSNKTNPSTHKYVEPSTTAEKGGGTKRKQHCWKAEWYAEFEDTSPVVKSKRGRNQVLPLKYRDSVVEPLARCPSSRHRLNSAAAFPSKRRSK